MTLRRAALADTGPLYAAVDPSDQHHLRAQRDLQRLAVDAYAVLLAFPILLETYTLVMGRLGTRVAGRVLSQAQAGASLLNPETRDYLLAAELVRARPDQRITMFDAVVAALSKRLDVPVWTYDADFDVLGVKVWR